MGIKLSQKTAIHQPNTTTSNLYVQMTTSFLSYLAKSWRSSSLTFSNWNYIAVHTFDTWDFKDLSVVDIWHKILVTIAWKNAAKKRHQVYMNNRILPCNYNRNVTDIPRGHSHQRFFYLHVWQIPHVYQTLNPPRRFIQIFEKWKNLQLDDSILISWKQAEKACKEKGGSLPYFMNRDDMEDFVAMIQLTEDIYPTDGIFIGLSAQGSQVGFTKRSDQDAGF